MHMGVVLFTHVHTEPARGSVCTVYPVLLGGNLTKQAIKAAVVSGIQCWPIDVVVEASWLGIGQRS